MTSNTLIHPQFDAGIISSLSVLSHLVLESSSLLKLQLFGEPLRLN